MVCKSADCLIALPAFFAGTVSPRMSSAELRPSILQPLQRATRVPNPVLAAQLQLAAEPITAAVQPA